MLVYNYSSDNNEYIGSSETFLDELESQIQGKDIYNIPANATIIIPPKVSKGYVNCFDERIEAWVATEDHRGEVVYNIDNLQEFTITELGPIPDNYLTEYPEPKNNYQIWQNGAYIYPDLANLKTTIKTDLDDKYNEKLENVYTVGNYFVQPTWATIYTNTLVAMQQDVSEDGKLDEHYTILLISDPIKGKLEQIEINSIEEFMPYYNKVKDEYKKLTTTYHANIVSISEATNAQQLVDLILNY
jgi:hypothetical protein